MTQQLMDWKQLPEQDPPKFAKPKGDERKRLTRARTALVLNNPFFGLLAIRLALIEAPWIITAGVDGKRFFYNPWYIAPLTDEELRGLWGHEVLHCTNGHMWRRGGREARKWNWAADYAIDPILVDAGLKVPNPTINPPWKGKPGEQIYNLLPEPPKQPCGGQGQGQGGQGDGSGGNGAPGQGQGGANDPRAPQFMPGKDVMLDPDQADAKQEQAEWKEATIQAAKVAKSQGKLPSNLEIYIQEWVTPRVDWKSALRRFVQMTAAADFTWRRPSSRHMGRGMYLPRIESEQMPPIVIGIDTSGSIGGDEMKQFTSEVASIIDEVKPEKTYVVFADAAVQRVQEFDVNDVLKFKPKGGGGTNMPVILDWVEKEGIDPACVIILTDMYTPFGEARDYPVMWTSSTKGVEAPWGETLYLDFE